MSLYDGSLDVTMKLFVDVSTSRGLHQDEKEIYASKTLPQYIKYKKRQAIIKFRWRASHERMNGEMYNGYQDWVW